MPVATQRTSRSPLPVWLPERVRLYLSHVEEGRSLRALARGLGVHASTVLRQVRRYETRRDDPLMDGALEQLRRGHFPDAKSSRDRREKKEQMSMRQQRPDALPHLPPGVTGLPDEVELQAEGRRILRRLAETGAILAFAADMEKAVVLRECADGRTSRLAVIDRSLAQAFVLKDWIACRKAGRISTYAITSAGRAALKRFLAAEDIGQGCAEEAAPFAAQHRLWGEREIATSDAPRRQRYNMAESPVAVLGRRREKDGTPFLSAELVEAAERLREDFELAQMGPRVTQNWERFLTAGERGSFQPSKDMGGGSSQARERVALALAELGPGLGDVALRVCCFLEGVEAAERRMGWASRSGKIVLRIALMRLRRHYDERYGKSGPLIG